MITKLISEPACPGKEEGNISVPIGLLQAFERYFELIGMNELLDGLKTKGVPLSNLIRCLCVYSLSEGENSMQACSDWLSKPGRLGDLGIEGEVSQRTLNRALEILGENRKPVIECLFKAVKEYFGIESDEPVAVDGSSIKRESDYGDLAGAGHPRDKNPDGMQTEFMIAVLQETRIPFYANVFSGEKSDEEQYARSLPEIISLIDTGRLDAYNDVLEEWRPPANRAKNEQIRPFKTDAPEGRIMSIEKDARMLVLDNGGSSKYNTDLIVGLGHGYITRKKLNISDKSRTVDESWVPVEPGVWCLKKVYADSGRTTYLFFVEALYAKKRATAERRFEKKMEVTRLVMAGKMPKSEMVEIHDIPFVDFDVKVVVQNVLSEYTEADREAEIKRMMGPTAGIFKLESSSELTPKEALDLYRRRVVVEHSISSLKQISGIKPLRVWKGKSVVGSVILALLTEAVLSMARFDLGAAESAASEDDPPGIAGAHVSTDSVRESLNHLTATYVKGEDGRRIVVYSNWEHISIRIFEAIHRRFGAKSWFRRRNKPSAKAAG